MKRPKDPVLDFIYDPTVQHLTTASRRNEIGYKLIILRCAQLGIQPPSRTEAREWRS